MLKPDRHSETIDLSGLRVAIRIAAAGQWHLYDRNVHGKASESEAAVFADQLLSMTYEVGDDLDVDNLRLLVDTVAVLYNGSSRADGWRLLGIAPSIGRRILNGSLPLAWPVFFTAYRYGLGLDRIEPDQVSQLLGK